MKALVYINTNHFATKASFEAVTYAKKLGGEVTVVAYGNAAGAEALGAYGANNESSTGCYCKA